jgi:site-specific recombinase XerD
MVDLKKFKEDLKKYYVYLEGRKSPHTIRAYKSTLNNFLLFVVKGKKEPNQQAVQDFLIDLKEDGDSSSSLNRHLAAIKSFFKFSHQLDTIKDIESYTTNIDEQEAIPMDRLKKLLEGCSFPFEQLLITVLISTGARIGEIELLCKRDIKDKGDLIILKMTTIKQRKGNVTRQVPIKAKWAMENIRKCLAEIDKQLQLKDTDHVFFNKTANALRHIVKDIGRRSGLARLHPHSFRHSFITEMNKKGVPIKVIQKLVGHSSVTITERYIHQDDDEIIDATPEI